MLHKIYMNVDIFHFLENYYLQNEKTKLIKFKIKNNKKHIY